MSDKNLINEINQIKNNGSVIAKKQKNVRANFLKNNSSIVNQTRFSMEVAAACGRQVRIKLI